MKLLRVFPYFSSNAFLMSPRSISERDTMMRISVLSLVPRPLMLLWRRSAKNPTLLLTHLTADKKILIWKHHLFLQLHNENLMQKTRSRPWETAWLWIKNMGKDLAMPYMKKHLTHSTNTTLLTQTRGT